MLASVNQKYAQVRKAPESTLNTFYMGLLGAFLDQALGALADLHHGLPDEAITKLEEIFAVPIGY